MKLIIVFACLYSSNLQAFDNEVVNKKLEPVLIHFVTEFLPPYQYLENGKVTGIVTEKVKRIAECANIQAEISLLPWARSYYTALNSPNTAIFSIAKTKERIDEFIWIGPIISLEQVVYKLKSRKDIKVESLADIKKYRLGLQRGDFTVDLLKQKANISKENIVLVSAKESQETMLFDERFDLTVTIDTHLKYNLRKLHLDENKVEPLISLGSYPLYLAMNKDSSPELVQSLKSCLNLHSSESKVK